MITLDGKEGGGQILRTALALSALTGKGFKITDIRAKRDNPGLRPQHYTCVKALQELTNAQTDAQLNSKELTFIPKQYTAQNKVIDIGTAGSTTLLLQSILLPAMFGSKTHTLTIKGGTDTKWSIPIDFLQNVLIPQYNRVSNIELKLIKRGYYPKGGGEIQLKIKPKYKNTNFDVLWKELQKCKFNSTEQGHLISIKGISHASKILIEREVAERQAMAAKQKLTVTGKPVEIATEYSDTLSAGSGMTLWAIFSKHKDEIDSANPIIVGADELGERGVPAEKIGTTAADNLIYEIQQGAVFDKHTADNIIPLMALCKPSSIKVGAITEHMRTNIGTTEAFLGKIFKIKGTIISS